MKEVLVLGAGSWGTALACHLASVGLRVRLWSAVAHELDEISAKRTSSQYLPGIIVPDSVVTATNLDQAADGADAILMAVPGRFFSQTLQRPPILQCAKSGISVINAGKGLSTTANSTHQHAFACEEFAELTGRHDNYISLSGPTFAKEIAEKHYSAILASGIDSQKVALVCATLSSPCLRVDAGNDVIGAEIGGVFKNGYAVLAGACAGLGYAANTYSATLTACLNEMCSFGLSQGAKAETFMGLSGIGDLILTAGSRLSRNCRLGFMVAQGKTVADAQAEIGQETEGYHTAMAAQWLSQRKGSRLTILDDIRQMLSGVHGAETIIARLFARD